MKRLLFLLLIISCSGPIETSIRDRQGNSVGTARFSSSSEGTQLDIVAFNLLPGPHGLHIHEFGACEAPDFATAGAHYNPDGREHGFNNPLGHHLGDLPNLDISAQGTGRLRLIVPVELREFKGKSIIIHAESDDLTTDPTGNSGARIGCGLIS